MNRKVNINSIVVIRLFQSNLTISELSEALDITKSHVRVLCRKLMEKKIYLKVWDLKKKENIKFMDILKASKDFKREDLHKILHCTKKTIDELVPLSKYKKTRNNYNRFSKEENNFLLENYLTMSTRELAERMKRTVDSVMQQKYRLKQRKLIEANKEVRKG